MTYVLKTMRGYPERIEGPAYTQFGIDVNKSLPGGFGNLEWEYAMLDKDLLGALKHVMQNKCSEVVSQLSPVEGGFELLRLLALKYDPVMPNLFQMLMASIYGLANEKCKDFRATVARVTHIERISDDIADQCGQRPDEGTLAGVFYPSMDHSSISDLVQYRISSGTESRAVHTDYFAA